MVNVVDKYKEVVSRKFPQKSSQISVVLSGIAFASAQKAQQVFGIWSFGFTGRWRISKLRDGPASMGCPQLC